MGNAGFVYVSQADPLPCANYAAGAFTGLLEWSNISTANPIPCVDSPENP